MTTKKGTIKASATVLSELIQPSQGNPAGTAHGGELLKMMDNCAGVCAQKHVRAIVVTAGIDNVSFHAPIHIGNQAICSANITYASKNSLEVAVTITSEDLFTGEQECCMTAFFIFCAIDESMKTLEIPPIILENDSERMLFEEGRKRAELRKQQPRLCWLPLYK